MLFLDELRRYLERPETPGPVYVPDVAAHRRHVLDVLEELEKRGTPDSRLRWLHGSWHHDRVGRFVQAMGTLLLNDLGRGSSEEEIRRLTDVALDRALGLETSLGTKVKDWQIDRLRQLADTAIDLRDRYEIARYALEIRAIRFAGDSPLVTPIGKLILELPDRDAVRWMLAAEVVQSLGNNDEWRMARESAARLLSNPEAYYDRHEDCAWPVAWRLLYRLSRMGVVELKSDSDDVVTGYALSLSGRSLLEEISSAKDTPFTLLAQALVQDETAAVIRQIRPAAMDRIESSADATARHARMVAHEIRNALVPVQSALEALYRDVERQGNGEVVQNRRDAIDGGIARVFRFLRDISQIADLASAPPDLFDLVPAVSSAIAAVASTLGLTIPFEHPGALPAVKGHRDRFVLAIVNLLRNAAQARSDGDIAIRIVAGVNNGAEVFVAVEDNGPGVPPEHRTNIFEAGFSLRPDGTGQGLALVREVVETEMAGRAICEESPLGGARIVLRLPVGTRRNG